MMMPTTVRMTMMMMMMNDDYIITIQIITIILMLVENDRVRDPNRQNIVGIVEKKKRLKRNEGHAWRD